MHSSTARIASGVGYESNLTSEDRQLQADDVVYTCTYIDMHTYVIETLMKKTTQVTCVALTRLLRV